MTLPWVGAHCTFKALNATLVALKNLGEGNIYLARSIVGPLVGHEVRAQRVARDIAAIGFAERQTGILKKGFPDATGNWCYDLTFHGQIEEGQPERPFYFTLRFNHPASMDELMDNLAEAFEDVRQDYESTGRPIVTPPKLEKVYPC